MAEFLTLWIDYGYLTVDCYFFPINIILLQVRKIEIYTYERFYAMEE